MSTPGNGHGWSLKLWRGMETPYRDVEPSPHRVAFLSRAEDWHCAMLAEFGMTTSAIQVVTGLSEGQINYRLRKLGIKRADFRNGVGPYAKMVVEGVSRAAGRQLKADIQMKLLE